MTNHSLCISNNVLCKVSRCENAISGEHKAKLTEDLHDESGFTIESGVRNETLKRRKKKRPTPPCSIIPSSRWSPKENSSWHLSTPLGEDQHRLLHLPNNVVHAYEVRSFLKVVERSLNGAPRDGHNAREQILRHVGSCKRSLHSLEWPLGISIKEQEAHKAMEQLTVVRHARLRKLDEHLIDSNSSRMRKVTIPRDFKLGWIKFVDERLVEDNSLIALELVRELDRIKDVSFSSKDALSLLLETIGETVASKLRW